MSAHRGYLERLQVLAVPQLPAEPGKARRRAHREGAQARFLAREAADPGLIEWFVDLESGGWKCREGDPIAASTSTTTFYRAATRRLAASGWLEWHLLEIDGRLAAAHLAARIGERRTLLRIACDESFSRLAPGNLLLAALLERTFELGDAGAVDCITDMPWHENWNLERYGYQEAWLHPHRLAAFPRWAKGVTQRLLRRGDPRRQGG